MKVTLIQTDLHWEDHAKNLVQIESHIRSVREETDLIVLPEMFSTGFSMSPKKISEKENGTAFTWMKKMAAEKNAVITGSLSIEDTGKYYNRLYWVTPNGDFSRYDKRHLFSMGKEDQHYSAGTKKIISKIENWKFCPLVCYDLRFPVWSRNRFNKSGHNEAGDNMSDLWDYDVLVYVANWPEVRNIVWKQLLVARALENQCYVIGVNRVGKDINDINHSGDSVVISPRGEVLSSMEPNKEMVQTLTLDYESLLTFRKSFPVGMDADDFSINIK